MVCYSSDFFVNNVVYFYCHFLGISTAFFMWARGLYYSARIRNGAFTEKIEGRGS